jgi:hypothetical protein
MIDGVWLKFGKWNPVLRCIDGTSNPGNKQRSTTDPSGTSLRSRLTLRTATCQRSIAHSSRVPGKTTALNGLGVLPGIVHSRGSPASVAARFILPNGVLGIRSLRFKNLPLTLLMTGERFSSNANSMITDRPLIEQKPIIT